MGNHNPRVSVKPTRSHESAKFRGQGSWRLTKTPARVVGMESPLTSCTRIRWTWRHRSCRGRVSGCGQQLLRGGHSDLGGPGTCVHTFFYAKEVVSTDHHHGSVGEHPCMCTTYLQNIHVRALVLIKFCIIICFTVSSFVAARFQGLPFIRVCRYMVYLPLLS